MGPSGCDKTCFTESLLLDHFEGVVCEPSSNNSLSPQVWQDGFRDMKAASVQFHERISETNHLKDHKSWFPTGGLLVLGEGGEDKELLDLFTKLSQHQNITVLYLCQDMFR